MGRIETREKRVVRNMGIKEGLDKLHNVTEEEIDQIILDQKIEDGENELGILKEIRKFKSFEDYVSGHEKDFDIVDITDDFEQIIISGDAYQSMSVETIKMIGIVANHYGIFVRVEPLPRSKIDRRDFRVEKKHI